jgi:hypothetical protein
MALAYPSASLQTEGYQLAQSKIAIGSGGPFGLGLGNGVQKVHFLPEPDNDFIFAVIGEELGLVGTTAIVLIFGINIKLKQSSLIFIFNTWAIQRRGGSRPVARLCDAATAPPTSL